MSERTGGADLAIGVVVVVVVGFIAMQLLSVIIGTLLFAVRVLVLVAVGAVAWRVISAVSHRRELRGNSPKSLR